MHKGAVRGRTPPPQWKLPEPPRVGCAGSLTGDLGLSSPGSGRDMTSLGQALIGRRGGQVGAARPGCPRSVPRGRGQTDHPVPPSRGSPMGKGGRAASHTRGEGGKVTGGARMIAPREVALLSRGRPLESRRPAARMTGQRGRASRRACARAVVRGTAWCGRVRARSFSSLASLCVPSPHLPQ